MPVGMCPKVLPVGAEDDLDIGPNTTIEGEERIRARFDRGDNIPRWPEPSRSAEVGNPFVVKSL